MDDYLMMVNDLGISVYMKISEISIFYYNDHEKNTYVGLETGGTSGITFPGDQRDIIINAIQEWRDRQCCQR